MAAEVILYKSVWVSDRLQLFEMYVCCEFIKHASGEHPATETWRENWEI